MDWHWGTFSLPNDLPAARRAASNALSGAGLDVWTADDNQYFAQGGGDAVVVTITMTPTPGGDLRVAVIANSTNGTAEAMRNLVRDLVQGHAPPPFPQI